MSEDHKHHTKCVVCDWQIEDGGIGVDFGERKLTVCSSECADKFHSAPSKYFLAAVVSVFLGLTTNPAIASSSDQAYQIIVAERSQLVTRHDATARSVDDLEKQISALRRDYSEEAKRAEDELDRQLTDKSRELKDLEFQIKDLDQALKRV